MKNDNSFYYCPCCGSENLERKTELVSDTLLNNLFSISYESVTSVCHSCNDETDVLGETDKNRKIAILEKQIFLIKQILNIDSNN